MQRSTLARLASRGMALPPRIVALALALTFGFAAAGCGGKKAESDQGALSKDVQAACTGSALAAAPKLPPSFPQIEQDKLTYTQQSTVGPTNVVEGYFNGDVKDAHEEFEKELKAAGYDILFNELEDHDSEISWKGEERTGQVAMREECGESDKTYVHITNRPAD
jgi:hypothetical protein